METELIITIPSYPTSIGEENNESESHDEGSVGNVIDESTDTTGVGGPGETKDKQEEVSEPKPQPATVQIQPNTNNPTSQMSQPQSDQTPPTVQNEQPEDTTQQTNVAEEVVVEESADRDLSYIHENSILSPMKFTDNSSILDSPIVVFIVVTLVATLIYLLTRRLINKI